MLTTLPYNLRGDEMAEKIEQLEAGLASDLNRELDVVNNNMMQYLIGTTELSHYLTALVDELNLSAKDEDALNAASSVIYELREEVKRLRNKVFELDCKVKVCVCCKTAYQNGTDNAEIIEKMGVCENCITYI